MRRNIDLLTTWRTPNPDCPACGRRMLHTAEERTAYHPFAGHGFDGIKGWTCPAIDPQSPGNQALARGQAVAAAYTPHAQITQRGN